jgi:hypothetical protein
MQQPSLALAFELIPRIASPPFDHQASDADAPILFERYPSRMIPRPFGHPLAELGNGQRFEFRCIG